MEKINFFEFVNQDWLQENEIPDDKPEWGHFWKLAQDSITNCHHLLNQNHNDILLKNLWKSTENIYSQKNRNIFKKFTQNILQETQKITSVPEFLAYLTLKIGNPFFSFSPEVDPHNSACTTPFANFGGLTLEDREQYSLPEHEKIREKFNIYLSKIGNLANLDFSWVFDWEREFAERHWQKQERRQPEKTVNKYTFDELPMYFREFVDETGFRKSIPHEVSEWRFYLDNPRGFEYLGEVLTVENIRRYMEFYLWKRYSSYFDAEADEISFDFFGRALHGTKKQRELWERRTLFVDQTLGELLGRLYVKEHFVMAAKERAEAMVERMRETMERRIQNLGWMSDATKERALCKLRKMKVRLGFPDIIHDYANLSLGEDLLENLMLLRQWGWNENLKEYYKPPIDYWEMDPQTVNAYFHPLKNEIVFPAAILQPPFFSLEASDAQNFGGIGMVICHEITHAFDDEGRKYDENGNLKDWWTEEDAKNFEKQIETYKEQWGEISVEGIQMVPGLIMGEALADHGGTVIALDALGENQNQREFFESIARIWACKRRPEHAKQRATTDPHPAPEHRVNITLRNCNEFHELYNTKEGDPMWLAPEKRLTLW